MSAGSYEFGYHIGKQFFADMENEDIRDADLEVVLTVEHKNDCYSLVFKVSGAVIVACDRCLDDLSLPVDTGYHVVVKYGDAYRDDNDEFLEIPESDSYLNVAYMIHDTVALAIPIKHVHQAGKCNRAMSALLRKHRSEDPGEFGGQDMDDSADGLYDGADDVPADSRWDKLKDLKI